MADFVAVLKKTIGGLSNNTPEARERVYQKARDTIAAKLAAMQPQPSKIVIDRQKKALEDAISAVEASFAAPVEPDDEFDAIFAGTDTKAKPDEATPAPVEPEPEAPEPEVAPEPKGETFAELAADTDDPEMDVAENDEPADAVKEAEATLAAAKTIPDTDSGGGEGEKLTPVTPVAKPDPVLAGAPASASGGQIEHAATNDRRRISGGLIAAVIAVIVVAAAGYGIWLNRDAFVAMISPADEVALAPTEDTDEAQPETQTPPDEAPAENVAEPAEEVEPPVVEDNKPKFTQRLTADGDEVDAGPAGGEATIGEGTSVAAATQQGNETAAGDEANAPAASNDATLPVGQRAIFYEERTTAADSTAEAGATVWSVVQESPGGDLPDEPAIRAEVTVPSKGIRMRMTLRRNADASLPASHIIEMIFLTSDGFEGGGIDNVLRVAMKPTEAAAGNPLIGIPAKIADGYFLIALSNVPEEKELNLQLMRQQSWIDIPIVYKSGRRALVTMERGFPGDRAFVDVLATWNSIENQAGEQSNEQSSADAGNN